MTLKALVGSGSRIGSVVLPFVALGLAANVLDPSFFSVGGPPNALKVLSIVIVTFGVVVWIWSVALIVTNVPRRELITTGPYSVIKHPLYTGVALLVLPFAGFLLNTWLGVLLGLIMYVASRIFAREEEQTLAGTFGTRWDEYCRTVRIRWL